MMTIVFLLMATLCSGLNQYPTSAPTVPCIRYTKPDPCKNAAFCTWSGNECAIDVTTLQNKFALLEADNKDLRNKFTQLEADNTRLLADNQDLTNKVKALESAGYITKITQHQYSSTGTIGAGTTTYLKKVVPIPGANSFCALTEVSVRDDVGSHFEDWLCRVMLRDGMWVIEAYGGDDSIQSGFTGCIATCITWTV